MTLKKLLGICMLATSSLAVAQKAPENWFNLDATDNNTRGLSSEKAYQTLLNNKKGRVVVVAVIDSGVEIDHEDLKGKIWVNTKEIPNNGIDDDKNGYIDDINGWNFLGGKDGKNVLQDSYELTREYARLSKKYKDVNQAQITNKEEYELFKKIEDAYQKKKAENEQQLNTMMPVYEQMKAANAVLENHTGKTDLTIEQVKAIATTDAKVKEAQQNILQLFTMGASFKDLKEYIESIENGKKYGYNTEFNPRTIIKDDPNNLQEKGYGNNDVEGPDAKHGTHVAGIIAANRENNLGMKGVANNVLIMAVRAVPDGDERDKDVANAIRYAVDNGANIINMSFGKAYSPNKELVDEAVKYAESKGVLLVHAAGNDGKNVDIEQNFPTRRYNGGKKEASNWLEIGASSWKPAESEFVAPFSNYGKKNVDVFAPGVDLYATVPNQKYESLSGTSMASPATAGVAAVLMSYYPQLKAKDVRTIIMKSSIKYDSQAVNKPGSEDGKVKLSELCITGGIVNAYEAIKMAELMSQKVGKK